MGTILSAIMWIVIMTMVMVVTADWNFRMSHAKMAPPLIPVGLEAVGAFAFHPFPVGERFSIGEIAVETLAVSHPGGAIAYKLTGEGRALVFIREAAAIYKRHWKEVLRIIAGGGM